MTFRFGAVITAGLALQPVRSQDHLMARPERGGAVSGNTYCAPSFFNDGSADHYIDGVALGAISTSGTGFTSDANGWNDRFFDGYGTVTKLDQGGSYDLVIHSGIGADMYYAWVDFDQDGAFAGGELVGSIQTGSPNEVVTIPFTVPGDAPVGYTGLRLICIDYYDPAPDPCGGYAYGEAEDYAVLISYDFPCDPINTEGTTQGDFISAINVGPYSGVNGYAGAFPYTAPNGAFHLSAGSPYDLTITSGEFETDRYKTWVDWNDDGVWDDNTEVIGEFASAAAFTAITQSFVVPDNAWGWFRMRVRCADADPLLPCDDQTWGETRDYMIVVDHALLPCLTYNFTGSMTGLGIAHFDVNGSNGDVPHGHPNHWILPLDPVVHVSPGDALDIAVTGMPGNAGNLVVCYADLNNDLDFDDANETSDYVQGTSPDQVMNFTLGIPTGTVPGGHWVRIASYGQGFEFVNACTDPVAGQVVDTYVIVDTPIGPCIPGFGSWTLDGHFIHGVQLGDIQNTGSGARFGPVYTDHPQSTTDLIVTHGYELLVTSGMQAVSTYRAWIDYNNDLDFNDAGELLGTATSDAAYQDLTIPFTVPDGTPLGEKHLRVRCDFGVEPGACEDGQWGETEDYRVEVGGNTEVADLSQPLWDLTPTSDGNGWLIRCALWSTEDRLILSDGSGRTVLTRDLTGQFTEIDARFLASGIYYIQQVGTTRSVARIAISH